MAMQGKGSAKCSAGHVWAVKLEPYIFGTRATPAACPVADCHRPGVGHYVTLYDDSGEEIRRGARGRSEP